MLILGIIGLFFPRILIIVLFFLTNWFQGLYDGVLIPILGFIFAPFALLWYTFVVNSMGGEWNILSIVGMVLAVAFDLGAFRSARGFRF